MRVSSSYEHALQEVFYHIGNRGICVNTDRIAEARVIVNSEIARNLAICKSQWGIEVFVGADKTKVDGSINLNATQGKFELLAGLKRLGYETVSITKKNKEGDYEQHYSAGELALQKMLARNQFNYPGGDPAIKAILKVRELGKLKSSYLNARLAAKGNESFFLFNNNVAGTLSGRRSSRRHTFGFGNNAQNFPKHSDVAKLFRRCLVARPGNIFLMVDQISAEDWPVSALAENHTALAELRAGNIDRHTALAAKLFNIPLASRTSEQWKESIERYLGKKTRHASNYDMRAPRMSDALAQEGFSFSEAECKLLLETMAQIDPNIKGVFHRYVQETLNRTRVLITPPPFQRERQFLALRPNDGNSNVFKEAYAFIPQSVVGDNTGFAVLALEGGLALNERRIVQEGHDSIVQDVQRTPEEVLARLRAVEDAFVRPITFYNGITINIPIEAEIGYDFNTTVKLKEHSLQGIREALQKLDDKISAKAATTIRIAVSA